MHTARGRFLKYNYQHLPPEFNTVYQSPFTWRIKSQLLYMLWRSMFNVLPDCAASSVGTPELNYFYYTCDMLFHASVLLDTLPSVKLSSSCFFPQKTPFCIFLYSIGVMSFEKQLDQIVSYSQIGFYSYTYKTNALFLLH